MSREPNTLVHCQLMLTTKEEVVTVIEQDFVKIAQ